MGNSESLSNASQVEVQIKKCSDGGEVVTLIFNGRTHLNVIGQQGMTELTEAMTEISKNENCQVVILTGEGDGGFIGGVDIKEGSIWIPGTYLESLLI